LSDQPKLIYLDSNDFSDLSEPVERLTDLDRATLQAIRDARRDDRARFFISPIHLSEAVHASELHKEQAVMVEA
jgi:hypothetical protein